MMNNSFELIAARLAEHEIALSEMYAQFARTFTVDAELWTSLSRDETRHAMWIDEVRQSVGGRPIQIAETVAKQQAVEIATTYTRSLTERCRNGTMTRRQAHALARDVENGMLERKLFEILARFSPEVANVREALDQETAAHRDKIAQAMARIPARAS